MSAPFIPTIHIESWQDNGYPVVAAFNVCIQEKVDGDTGEMLREGIPSQLLPGETVLIKSEPYPHWNNRGDSWVRCWVKQGSSDINPPDLQLWRSGSWTEVTPEERSVLLPRIKGRLRRVASSLDEAAQEIPANDA